MAKKKGWIPHWKREELRRKEQKRYRERQRRLAALRLENFPRRSAAAKKGWKTRRRNAKDKAIAALIRACGSRRAAQLALAN